MFTECIITEPNFNVAITLADCQRRIIADARVAIRESVIRNITVDLSNNIVVEVEALASSLSDCQVIVRAVVNAYDNVVAVQMHISDVGDRQFDVIGVGVVSVIHEVEISYCIAPVVGEEVEFG